jgi:hypothetical protein
MNEPIGGTRRSPEPVLHQGGIVAFALGDTSSDLQAAARLAGALLGQSAQHLQVLVGTARVRVAALTGRPVEDLLVFAATPSGQGDA